MSVKIEVLDYIYGEFEGTQMISNFNFNSSDDWDLGTGWSISSGEAVHSGNIAGYIRQYNLTFIQGQTNRIKYRVSNRTSGSFILANHLAGNANGFNQTDNGAFIYDWVQGSNNNDRLSLYGSSSFDGSIEYVQVYPISGIDWDNSIVGELDISDHSDFPLAMTFQISDFKDLTSTSGDYSKTFKIPATKNNNNILKHLFIPTINIINTVTDKKPCRITFNELNSLVGLIQVDGVGGYGETPSYYNCVFFGNNLNWASRLEDGYLHNINWGASGDGITYNKNSIIATWDDLDCTSSDSYLVYPITSYGDYNSEGIERTIQLLDTALDASSGLGLSYSGFNDGADPLNRNFGTPPPSSDWRPALFVKNTLDKIFKEIGYQINSVFMNTDLFKKLVWLLPNFQYNNPDDRTIKYGYGNTFIGEGFIQSHTASVSGNTSVYSEFNVNLNNAGSDFVLDPIRDNTGWSLSDGVFTSLEYGYYNVTANNFAFYWDNWSPSTISLTTEVESVSLKLQISTVSQSTWNTIDISSTGTFNIFGNVSQEGVINLPNINTELFLNAGDKLRLRATIKIRNTNASVNSSVDFHLFGSSSPTSSTLSNSANGSYNININPLPVSYGQTYNLSEVINKDYSQIDFIKGIAHSFNLKFSTNEMTRTVDIEPFDNFFKPYAEAIDWTYKLDRSLETNDKWLDSDLKRNLVFKYKSDNQDAMVKQRGIQFFDNIQDEFPYREELSSKFNKGDSTFENPFFAGTYNGQDQDTVLNAPVDTAYSGILWTSTYSTNDIGRPDKGTEFLPRLLYWNKYSPATSSLNEKRAVVQTWAFNTNFINANASVSNVLSNIYPQATMVNRDSILSPNLAYGNTWVSNYDDATGVYGNLEISKGLFDTYYKKMIEGLKINPRLRTLYITLNTTDIVNLDFRKLVYIDGVYWRINKVSDYKPSNNESTKVELIEWFQLGTFAATSPSFGSSDLDWNPNGEVVVDLNWSL